MWLSTKQTQSRRIVLLLSQKGELSAKQLHRYCSPPARRSSIQSIYKDLRSLEASGVVVRSAGEYSLSLTWLLELGEFARDASDVYLGRVSERLLLGDKPKRTWKFSDLRLLDSFWMEILLAASKTTTSKQLFGWIPHPWFDLLQPSKVSRFRTQLISEGVCISHIIGGELPLDKNICRGWPARLFRYSHARGPFEGQDASYIQLIGDYLVTVTLDRECVGYIERLFQRSVSKSNIDLYSLNKLLIHKVRAKVSVERNPSKMGALRKKFEEYFA